MAIDLALPRAAGTRDMVDVVLEEQHIPTDLQGQTIIVSGDEVVDASPSFADELVRMLAERHASKVVLVHIPSGLAKQIKQSAKLRRFSGIK